MLPRLDGGFDAARLVAAARERGATGRDECAVEV